jgi:hypothetical protein
MKAILFVGVFVCCSIDSRADQPVAAAPKENPVIKCEVRWTGKAERGTDDGKKLPTRYAPDLAEVKITNISKADVDIGSSWGPYANLDVKIKGPDGKDVKTDHMPFLGIPSATLEHAPYMLKPGRSLEWSVSLLVTIPESKRITGTYKVKAVYTIGKKDYESDWVEVKWPESKK